MSETLKSNQEQIEKIKYDRRIHQGEQEKKWIEIVQKSHAVDTKIAFLMEELKSKESKQ